MSAVRSAAAAPARGAGGEQDLGRHVLPPLPLDDEVVDLLDPALAHRLGDRREPEDDAGLLLHDPRARPSVLGNGRRRGHVAGADVLGQRTGDDLPQGLAQSAIEVSLFDEREVN